MTSSTQSGSDPDTSSSTCDCIFCGVNTFVDSGRLYDRFTQDLLISLEVASNTKYRLVLDIAPLAPFHVLLVPTHHVTSFAFLQPTEWEPLFDDVRHVFKGLTDREAIAFEHGVTNTGTPGDCCISHAHLHMLPAGPLPLRAAALNRNMQELVLDFNRPEARRTSYFFVRESDRSQAFFDPSGFHSQFLRRIVADLTQQSTWHWHDYVQFVDPTDHSRELLRQVEALRGAVRLRSQHFRVDAPRTRMLDGVNLEPSLQPTRPEGHG